MTRQRDRRVPVLAVTAVLILGLGAAPGLRGAPARDVLVIAKDISDIRTPDPNKSYDVGGVFLQFPAYSRLVSQRAPDFWRVRPDLAVSWDISRDATVYTFKLRPDAVFASGDPVTSEDVRFSLLRMKNIKGYGSFLAAPIKDIETVDAKTVRIALNNPDAAFLSVLAAGLFSIVNAREVRAAGGVETPGADTLDKAEPLFYRASTGSGSYVVRRYARESEIVLERNERYYGSKPYFRQVIVKHVKDPSTQAFMLQRGDADIALDLTVDQVENLKGKPGLAIYEDPSAWTVYVGLNTSVKPWDNPRIRHAARLAIDYDGVVSGVMRGHGRRIGSIMMPGMLGFPEPLNKELLYPQDLRTARALMLQAGVTAAKVKLTWQAGSNYGTLNLDRLAQKLKADLARIGIDLELTPAQPQIFLTYYRQGRPETAIGFWFPDFMDPDNWSYFVTGFIDRRLRWSSPEGARLVRDAKRTPDPARRAELYAQYNRVLASSDSPYVHLVQSMALVAARADVGNYRFHPLYFLEIDALQRK
ncbi:MAG: ABC transporter substrate-binding protein [Armatimonadetes bacterium]|nr:ABC transporter substrate-binding protein [Armatimonadota bacterium]